MEQWQPPENPAKETDARFAAYVEEYGASSWELDAIEPRMLAALVTDAVQELIDKDLWDDMAESERQIRADLLDYAYKYRSNGNGKEE